MYYVHNDMLHYMISILRAHTQTHTRHKRLDARTHARKNTIFTTAKSESIRRLEWKWRVRYTRWSIVEWSRTFDDENVTHSTEERAHETAPRFPLTCTHNSWCDEKTRDHNHIYSRVCTVYCVCGVNAKNTKNVVLEHFRYGVRINDNNKL